MKIDYNSETVELTIVLEGDYEIEEFKEAIDSGDRDCLRYTCDMFRKAYYTEYMEAEDDEDDHWNKWEKDEEGYWVKHE